jgi:hypothetical protein
VGKEGNREARRLRGLVDQREIKFRVSGDGHGYRELAPGFRRLKAERPNPEELTTVAVTRHQK